jgi:AraC-like DNA-binding protein
MSSSDSSQSQQPEQEKRSVRVRRMIQEVELALQTQTPAQVSSQFADYQKEFPKLFEMVLTRTYNREIMAMMIDQFERVERGTKSQHDASVAVGTVLVDTIVKPQLKAAESKK